MTEIESQRNVSVGEKKGSLLLMVRIFSRKNECESDVHRSFNVRAELSLVKTEIYVYGWSINFHWKIVGIGITFAASYRLHGFSLYYSRLYNLIRIGLL